MIGGELQFNPKQHRYLKAFPKWYLLESRKKPMRIAISWLMSNVECRTRHIFYLTCHNRLWNIIFHENQSNIAIRYTQQTSLKKQILYAIQYAYMKNVAAPFFSCLSEESLELYNFKLTSGLDSEHFLHITFNQNLPYRSWINYIFPIHHVKEELGDWTESPLGTLQNSLAQIHTFVLKQSRYSDALLFQPWRTFRCTPVKWETGVHCHTNSFQPSETNILLSTHNTFHNDSMILRAPTGPLNPPCNRVPACVLQSPKGTLSKQSIHPRKRCGTKQHKCGGKFTPLSLLCTRAPWFLHHEGPFDRHQLARN